MGDGESTFRWTMDTSKRIAVLDKIPAWVRGKAAEKK
jgi:hypothetical protein